MRLTYYILWVWNTPVLCKWFHKSPYWDNNTDTFVWFYEIKFERQKLAVKFKFLKFENIAVMK